MRTAVVVFPGTNCEQDVAYALTSLGGEVELVWHRETDLSGFDGVVLPGGFAHGDYLRTGAIARFSPVMAEVERMASQGSPVLGICNGFQVLCEAGLLPGALIANRDLAFICRFVDLEVTDNDSILTRSAEIGQRIQSRSTRTRATGSIPEGRGGSCSDTSTTPTAPSTGRRPWPTTEAMSSG